MIDKLIVYIIDDDVSVLNSLKCLIESVGYNVKTFSTAQEFIDIYNPSGPACLIVDVRMPIMSGLELQQYLYSHNINVPIVFISAHGDIPMAVSTIKNGAENFLTKPINNQNLLEAVNKAIKNDIIKYRKHKKCDEINIQVNRLTKREKEILKLMVEGKMTKYIADKLAISPNTVDQHRMKVMNKMDVKCVAELVNKVITYKVMDSI